MQNYGLSILLFTILLKVVLFPISYKQHKSSLAMVRLKPYQEELRLAGLDEEGLRQMDPDDRVALLEQAELDPYDYIYLAC